MEKTMQLPEEVEYLISKLKRAGYRADVVGGAVRDFLLGKEPSDYDITTSAEPDEIKSVFSADRTVDTGIQHGTVSVILSNKAYEITSYRIDGEYLDSRHPASVSFTRNIEEDLKRRDFTVNAMAYNRNDGLTDLFFGRRDLQDGIIRAVGDAETRFSEDALRILRALRFASMLDFIIEENTASAMYSSLERLKAVSVERIYTEWQKLLAGKGAWRIINKHSEIIKVFLDELSQITLPEEEKFNKASPVLRFASLFHFAGYEKFKKNLKKLRVDNKTKELAEALFENYLSDYDRVGIKFMLSRIGEEKAKAVLEFRELLSLTSNNELSIYESVLESGECYSLSALAVNGNELISLGTKGKKTGEVLSSLLSKVIKGELPNEKNALLREAVKII